MSKENLEAGFFQYLFNVLKENDHAVDISPYAAAYAMNSVNNTFSYKVL